MQDIDKKLKGGLRKCPVHKFGSRFELVSDGVNKCLTCGGYVTGDSEDGRLLNAKKSSVSNRIIYEFDNCFVTKI